MSGYAVKTHSLVPWSSVIIRKKVLLEFRTDTRCIVHTRDKNNVLEDTLLDCLLIITLFLKYLLHKKKVVAVSKNWAPKTTMNEFDKQLM